MVSLAGGGEAPWLFLIDRKAFFDAIRESLFYGVLSQRQVDGMNYLLDVWEARFAERDMRWLAYAFATVHHETAFMMVPLEEYGKGQGKPYGAPAGPHGECYYGRGHVQLTWEDNYIKGEQALAENYGLNVPMHQYPHRMLEDETSALILYDGMIEGWFTGLGLNSFFNADVEDPVNARKIVNGLDKADLIADYYFKFKAALDMSQRRQRDGRALKTSPLLLVVVLLNAGMIWALIYVASSQREERKELTKMLTECQHTGSTP